MCSGLVTYNYDRSPYQVGVDNMCILVNAAKRQPLELPLEGRISNALVEVGPSITLASLSEVLAFAVGSFIPMPACRVFSMFAGWKFVYLLTFHTSEFFLMILSLALCFCEASFT